MLLKQLSKHICHSDWGISKTCILNASTVSSDVEKRWPLNFFYVRCHSVANPDYTADDSSNRCSECSKMQLFEPIYESSHCCDEEWFIFGGWFFWFLGRQLANKWLCTSQNWLFCVVLVARLWHVQFSLFLTVKCSCNIECMLVPLMPKIASISL